MRFTYAIEIDAPVEEVFELVETPEKMELWIDGLEVNEFPPGYDRTNPVGTRFQQGIRESGRLGRFEGVVTAYEKLRRFGIRLMGRRFTADVDYSFTPLPGKTRVDYASAIHFQSFADRLMAKAFRHLAEGIIRNQMWRL
ncbi:MAG TPA: SRPBCC family protein, partial [Thermoanaerobaculia bacterium]|nr:SRPBCC family protein [Thermoanaerobaculia bacterium]